MDSVAQDSSTRSSAKPTNGAAASSPATGPGSPSTTTSAPWLANTLKAQKGRGWAMGPEENYVPVALISSQAGSRARTSQSPDADGASPGKEAGCSTSSPGSQTGLLGPEDGFSSRTSSAFFPLTTDEISESFSQRWPKSGSWTGPGECWTHNISESPSAGGASSSLPDVLEATAPEKYFLSPRGAAGILRRATKRGRRLPQELEAELTSLAALHVDTGKASTPPSTTGRSS